MAERFRHENTVSNGRKNSVAKRIMKPLETDGTECEKTNIDSMQRSIMLKRKYILPVSIFAGVFHFFFWLNFAGVLMAMATSIAYGLAVYWSYRYLERRR